MNTESMVALAATLGQIGSSVKEVTEAIDKLSNTFKISRCTSADTFNFDNLQEGEITYNTELKTCYVYNEEKLIPIQEETILKANYEDKIEETKTVNGNLNMSLYDLNKAAITQLTSYSASDKQLAIKLINDFEKNDIINLHYYMLLGRDLNYYTVFARHAFNGAAETFGELVIECLDNLGDIKSIELTDAEDAIEVWIMDSDGEGHVLYLFNYDKGVEICQ